MIAQTSLVGRRVTLALDKETCPANSFADNWFEFFERHLCVVEAVAYHPRGEASGEFLALVSNEEGDTAVVPMHHLRLKY